jgi:hypothetical protein
MKLRPLALAVALLFSIPASATDAASVLAAPRQRMETADFRASGHLVRMDESGARSSYPISIKAHWFPGVLRVYMELGAGSKAGANSLLSGHIPVHVLFEMRPSGKNTILIAHPGDKAPAELPFDQWSDGPLGPGFSYEDFLEPQYFWPGQAVLEATKFGARDCDVVKSTPGTTDKTHYAEVRSWLDHSIGFPVYVEKTLKATGAVKEFTSFGLRQEEGVWSASQVEVKTRGHAGSTLLIIDRGSARANLGLGEFSPEKLTRFQDR